jgi:probable rRNA maturation factor
MIHYRNAVRNSGVDGRALKVVAQRLLVALGERESSLSLTLVDDDAIREINSEHRGQNKPTDVLSFPAFEPSVMLGLANHDGPFDRLGVTKGERMLGDVVISIDTARRQAADYDASLRDELHRLLVHGIAHVMGHDHQQPQERAAMRSLERKLAAAIDLAWPYDG